LEAGLTKVDPEAPALLEKEKAAFRERMVKARELRKAQVDAAARSDGRAR
ncbi:hypothetical protein EMGBD4_10740, partial [Verrucomicrobiota bacterium]